MGDRDKIEKRGFAYRCCKCEKYEGERRYVEAHFFKCHATLDSVPFYCSLCHFMGKTERELLKHLKGYRPHKQALDDLLRRGAMVGEPESYVHKNQHPIQLDETCIKRLSLTESRLVWQKRQKAGPGEEKETKEEPPSDPLKQLPEALVEDQPTVPAAILPPLDLPMETDDFNVLEQILNEEEGMKMEKFGDENRREEKVELQRKMLETMESLLHVSQQNGQLLTSLNMGIRKNTMVLEDIAESLKARERDERRWRVEQRRWWTEERRRWTEERRPADRRRTVLGRASQSASSSRKWGSKVKSVVRRAGEE